MPQKTNLNVNPYYDDFEKLDNFYKVLFKPGYPVQARELTGLQSILQNQVESFGTHVFKEGSMVIPGGITCDNEFTTIKVNPTHLGIDVSVYLDALVAADGGKGAKVIGETSEVVGKIKGYLLPPELDVEEVTLFVKYSFAAKDASTVEFFDGEVLRLEENVSYGNTTLVIGDTILTLVSTNAASTGYAVGVDEGVYFIRGHFVDVPKAQIVLDPYNNEPSFRVGFDVVEEIVNADQDESLNDNAKGFTNYAAPGADRLKISTKLAKKQLTDNDDTNFIELVKIDEGKIRKIQNASQYSKIRDYFAKRTFDESGNYAVENFIVETEDSLNDEVGNGGIFREDEVTDEGNDPVESNLAVKVSAGTAYVRGYDTDLVSATVLDVKKPRTTKKIDNSIVNFSMGGQLRVNNVAGTPFLNIGNSVGGTTDSNVVQLHFQRRNESGTNNIAAANSGANNAGLGVQIGEARVYWFGLTDDSYKNAATEFDLYLYDIQTFTKLTLGNTYNQTDVPLTSFVRGLSSGATGYLHSSSSNEYFLSQTAGNFLVGEQVIINEEVKFQTGIQSIEVYSVEDIHSVFQNVSSLNGRAGTPNFVADAVLYPKEMPQFSKTDQITLSGSGGTKTATIAGRFFAGVTGIKEGRYFKYQNGNSQPVYSYVSGIAANGLSIDLTVAPFAVPKVNHATHGANTGQFTFNVMCAKIKSNVSPGLYSPLPVNNIASVDLGTSDLTISKQVPVTSFTGNKIELDIDKALDSSAGITSAYYEAFDAERYSITYSDGSIEPLTSDQFTLGNNGGSITLNGLGTASGSNATVNVTLTKRSLTSKGKNYIRSEQVAITRTQKASAQNGLTASKYYGLRIEDNEISLNVPDVANVRAVLESTDENAPVLDKLVFATGLALDQNAIVGEKIVGQEGRAVGQVVSRTATEIFYISRNTNNFRVGETVKFKESAIESTVQKVVKGSYVNLTANYRLDSGDRNDYVDYSRIIRRPASPTPDKQLLVIYDCYKISPGDTGDFFSVNSYSAERYKSDLPNLPNGLSASDIIDFRPRVSAFDPTTTASPFAFSSRQYESTYKYIISPDEVTHVGYSYYLPRIDLVTINRLGEVEVVLGEAADNPQAPILADDAMELAQISYPAYLYNAATEPRIFHRDNRRFTMRDIGKLESRIETLEELTSLTMLELSAKTTEVTDAEGFSRFKSGFVVSDFRNASILDPRLSTVDIDKENATVIPPTDNWSIHAELAFDPGIDITKADLTQNLKLQDPNCQKSGDIVTLKYEDVEFLNQPHATRVENVNPFTVTAFVGGVILDPPSDNWVRTIYIDDHRTESTGAKWKHQAKVTKDVDRKVTTETYDKGGGRGEKKKRSYVTTTIKTTTKYKRKLTGPSREFNYVENVKVSGEADPWMRSRNVYFAANGLRPYTKHYKYLDSQQVDFCPKVCEIQMESGTFTVFEKAFILDTNNQIVGFMRIQKPNHKFGDRNRPDIAAGLGSPAVYVEKYTVDPYDRNRPAPGDSYSPTSKLINFGVRALGVLEDHYGYVEKGFKVVGRDSGAVATITRAELISDNWGDIIGAFYFRNPNSKPKPAVRVKSGTKTVKLTALPPNTIELPGSTVFASEAVGTYSGSGTILTQETSRVSVRNPPKPKRKPTKVQIEKKVTHRDPLAQSFTVPGAGIFFTGVDLFFARKDPSAKVFVELRTMELGTPTDKLVADWCEVALNPNQININEANPFEPVPTRVTFPSPVFLEGGDREYAIVVLSPASDSYELWTAKMKEKTVRTTSLPDVQNVVVSKQYIGGSLFKSQNGTIWTPSQEQDMTFKIYKAKFVESGTVLWYNTNISADRNSDNAHDLNTNPIQGLPRKLKLPISNGGNLTTAAETLGTKIGQGANSPSITGFIENLGGPASTISLATGGSGYFPSQTSLGSTLLVTCDLVSLSGKGTGGQVKIATDANGVVTDVSLTNNGSNYVAGELVEIDTSTIGGTDAHKKGQGAKFTIDSIGTTDCYYLTDVQGENFADTTLLYTIAANGTRTAAGTGVAVNGNSSLIDDRYSGNVFSIKQQDHAHHGGNNKIKIQDVEPDTKRTELTATFGTTDTVVSVANTFAFQTFEGIHTARGYALINNEIIQYTNVTAGVSPAGTLTISNRSIDGTIKIAHNSGDSIQAYQVNGVSLTRINREHDIPATSYRKDNSDIDNYFLEVDRSLQSPTIRSSGDSMLNFTTEKGFGGDTVGVSQNAQYSVLTPAFNIITPGKGTVATCNVRTVSGTSAGGSEVSFQDMGYTPAVLNKPIFFDTPRMVASRVNELARLSTLPRSKSLTLRVDMSTQNEDLSPMMDTANAEFVCSRFKSNAPIDDYVSDSRSNNLTGDPHGAVLVTRMISLAQPATSLKLFIAAHRADDADFRVFYQLRRLDSGEIDQKFIPFPGYDNLIDSDGDGYGDRVIDPNKNSGRADAKVPANGIGDDFAEYQFSVDNLDEFQAFAIKIVMSSKNESRPIKLRDFRAIALA